MSEDELITRTAYHESGHALMAVLHGGKIEALSLIPDEDEEFPEHYGEIRVAWPEDLYTDRELAIFEIKVALAGPIAEMVFAEEQFAPEFIEEWRYDWQMAVDRAQEYLSPSKTIAEHLGRYAYDLLAFFERKDVWAAVAGLADQLEAHETLEMEEIQDVLDAWPIEGI